MHGFDENNDNCYVCIRDLFFYSKASNMRLNSSTVGPHAMLHVYTVYIDGDHYRTKLSLFNRYICMCMESLFYSKRRANEEESINKSCLVHQPEIKHILLNRRNIIGRGFRCSIIIIIVIII